MKRKTFIPAEVRNIKTTGDLFEYMEKHPETYIEDPEHAKKMKSLPSDHPIKVKRDPGNKCRAIIRVSGAEPWFGCYFRNRPFSHSLHKILVRI